LVVGVPVASAAEDPEAVYVVQPGDTCGTIGRKLFGDPNLGSARLHALNDMGPPPHKLLPGKVLRVRGEPDARLTFIKPDVNARRAGKVDWQEADQGQGLWRLDAVNTLNSAGAEVTFVDETRLQMNENAFVVIYGQKSSTRPDALEKSGMVELVQGEMNISLAALRGEGVGVKTPAAAVAARSKSLLVDVDAQKMSRVSVYDGQAEVAAQGQRVQVPKGHGTRVAQGKVPEKPRPLPEAPQWAGGNRSVRLLMDGQGVDEELGWAAVKEAAHYRVELARDERFNDAVHKESVQAGADALRSVARTLGPGLYYARVRAVDAAGLVGSPSEVRHVEVLRVKASRGVVGPQGIQGATRVEFAVDNAEALEFRLDGVPVTHPVRVESVGTHTLEMVPRGVPEARPEKVLLTVLPPRVVVDLEPLGDAFRVKVQVLDETGKPLEGSLSPLKLRGLHGTQLEPLQEWGPGVLETRAVPGQRNGERFAAVEALWGEASVGQVNVLAPVTMAPAAKAQVAAPKGPDEVSLLPMLGVPTQGVETAALPSAFLPRAWLGELRLQPDLGTADNALSGGRASLLVEGRVGEAVALGTTLVFRPEQLGGEEDAPGPGLSATVAGRVRLTEHPRYRLLLGFDATLTGAGFGPQAEGLRLRPSLLAAAKWERWVVATGQGYSLRPGLTEASWDSAWQLWFLPLPRLALGAEVEGRVDATPREQGPVAFAAGVGARLRLGAWELGASVRRGLGQDGEQLWGPWGGLLTVGWSGLEPRGPP
jgi:hypothetical protein